jgi:hypothetical protein
MMALALLAAGWSSAGPLLAKPTRTLTRPSAHKLVFTQPAHRTAHDRGIANSREASVRQHSVAASALRNGRRSGREPASSHLQFDRKHPAHSRTLAEERAAAAQAAIDAADRRPREQARHTSLQRSRLGVALASIAISPQSHGPESEEPTLSDETQNDAVPPASASSLTNIGGVLRPTSGSLSLSSMPEPSVAPLLLPPLKLSSLYDGQGRLILPRPLYGSHEILLHQNQMADRDGLDRVQNDADLQDLRRQKQLVPLPESEGLRVDYRLPEDRRFSRPWTAAFLSLLAADFYAAFHTPLQVDSAVRTVAVQQRLLRTNGNAAPTTGETASPHLTGQAVDIAKGGLNLTEIAWMRTYLQPMIDAGKIDVEEEFQQSCFHISVYRSFVPTIPAHLSVAAARQAPPPSEAERPTY